VKKNALVLSAAAIASLFITCSKLDTSSTVGAVVVNEYDSTLTHFEQNFYPVQFDTSIVIAVQSLPVWTNAGFGYHTGLLAAGNVEGRSVYGSISFQVTRSFAKTFDSTRTLTSISFAIDTIVDSARPAYEYTDDSLQLYTSSLSTRYSERAPDAPMVAAATLSDTADTKRSRFTGSLSDTALQQSIFAICRSFEQCDTCTTELDSIFYFSFFKSDTLLRWFRATPRMVFHSVNRADTSKKYYDTLYGTSSYVVNESVETIEALSTTSVSTFHSRRTAVFKLNFVPLWDSLTHTGFNEILAASISLQTDSLISETGDSSAKILYLVSDRFLENGDTYADTLKAHIDNSFSLYTTIDKIKNDSLSIPIGSYLQYIRSKKPASLYLYLQIASTDILTTQEVYWKKPQVKAVLTTIR